MLADTLAVAWKELQILSRDRGQLAVLFMMPVMFAAVIGSAFSGGSPGIRAFLVNQDTGPYSAQVVDILEQIDVLRLTELETVEEADQRVADGEALGAIVIPQGFDQAIDTFGRTHVRVIVDPTQQQYGSIVVGILNEVLAPVILQGEIKHGIQVVLDESGVFDAGDESARRMIEAQTLGVVMTRLREAFENPTIAVKSEDLEGVRSQSLDSGYEYTTPSYAVMFAFFIVGTIASSLLREREEGTFRRLMASPIHRAALIAGTIVAYMLVVGLQVLVVLSVGRIFF